MLLVNHLIGFGAADEGAAAAIEIAGTATASGSTSSSVYTSGSLSIGAADAARHIVVAVAYRLDVNPTGCTVGGISAGSPIVSARATNTTPDAGVSLFWVAVPTGTAAVTTVTFPSGNGECAVTLFRMLNAASVSDFGGTTATSTPVTLDTVTIPSNGAAVWAGEGTNDPNGLGWTNATEYSDFDAGSFQVGAAYSITAGTPSVKLAQTSGGTFNLAIVGASFTP